MPKQSVQWDRRWEKRGLGENCSSAKKAKRGKKRLFVQKIGIINQQKKTARAAFTIEPYILPDTQGQESLPQK
jgi:hypothetical protein